MCFWFRRRSGRRAARSARSHASIEQLLRRQIPTWERIRSITGQTGISIGVIYRGAEVFKRNAGVLDIATGRAPDSDTLYCIASLSKAFMAASLDLLVQEGKISWESTIHSVIPEFKHVQQPTEYAGMTGARQLLPSHLACKAWTRSPRALTAGYSLTRRTWLRYAVPCL
jgi:CubicO group peptidase (beta-lactamase class C family)